MNDLHAADKAARSVAWPEGGGRFLREARERAGISLQDAAKQVRMPARVLQAVEDEEWEALGAPVFVRGQLRSYARLLKVDVTPYLEQARLEHLQPVELVSRAHTPRYQRLLENLARRAVYVVLTAAIAVPVWVATQWDASELSAQRTQPLDAFDADGKSPARIGVGDGPEKAQASPVVASLASLPRGPGNGLVLRTRADSWVEIEDVSGRILEKGLLQAGQERRFSAGQVGRVVIGNASAVEVQRAGATVDLAPYQRANVARFAVSSDGSLVPIAH